MYFFFLKTGFNKLHFENHCFRMHAAEASDYLVFHPVGPLAYFTTPAFPSLSCLSPRMAPCNSASAERRKQQHFLSTKHRPGEGPGTRPGTLMCHFFSHSWQTCGENITWQYAICLPEHTGDRILNTINVYGLQFFCHILNPCF